MLPTGLAGGDAQPADLITASIDFTSGSMSECQDGRSIRAGAPSWWCEAAPRSCSDVGAVEWPSVVGFGARPHWGSTYCVNATAASLLSDACATTRASYGGDSCVLYFYDVSDAQSWQVATVLSECGGPSTYGGDLSEQCIGREPLP